VILTPTVRATLLAFLTAGATLFTQVLVHRMVSAKLLNNYAFLVISLTMLGFAFSGVILTRWLARFLEELDDAVSACAALFVLSLLGASIVFYQAPATLPASFGRLPFVIAFLKSIPLALLYALPFTFCGLILGALLSARQFPTRRVYFFDLAGSALGAFAVIPAISLLGVEVATIVASAVMLVGALGLAPPRRLVSRVLVGGAVVALVLCSVGRDTVFDLNYPRGTMLHHISRLPPPAGIEHVSWDPIARIELSRIPEPKVGKEQYPSLVGGNARFHERFERVLTQNNYAFTYAVNYDGTRASLEGIEETIYAAAYEASSIARPRVGIVGVGGGFDVLTALYFDSSRITAVEINQATVDILRESYREYFAPWVEDPRVRLVVDEGRHFLATTGESYDVLQLSGVDSYAGTAAAAHVFSENYLYTREAFDIYLDRLTPDGILNMMRLEWRPPREMLRALTTAVAALRADGVSHPADHILMVTQTGGGFTSMLVKKTPFTPDEVRRLADWAAGSEFFSLTAGPGLAPDATAYQLFLSLDDPSAEAYFIAKWDFDISPVSDNRPFFFKYSFWSHLFPYRPAVAAFAPVMEYSVILLGVLIGVAAFVAIFLPLWYLARQGLAAPSRGRWGVFFAGTGLGYLAIEIALLQKFGLFLGHPNYSLSVVLAALLFSTGLGSLFSAGILRLLRELRVVSYVLGILILLEYALALPRLPAFIGLPFVARVALVVALVFPLGLCLGVFVPSALERLKPTAPEYVPWAWGINGIFSVLAPVLSVAFSMTWGINALLLAAIPVYLTVGWCLPPVRSSSAL
jgi:spermidine synthase